MTSVVSPHRPLRLQTAAADAGIVIAATLAFVVFHAVRGFPSLADGSGDNDSLLRMVQVRELIAGQGWYDLTLYRMGLEGGFVMHWSRLVDLPIAVLVATLGERAAMIVWPMLLFGLCLYLILRTSRLIGGAAAILPAAVIGGLALFYVNQFRPGALDHHNVQLTLALGALCALTAAKPGHAAAARWGALAGACAALMLAVGMEAAPYAAVACAVAAMRFLLAGPAETSLARGFGAAFAGVSAAALFSALPVYSWLSVQCDALSLPQASLAVLGGGGLALIASIPVLSGSLRMRAIAFCILAAVISLVAVTAFPQCLGDPYADLDPTLRTYWLSAVSEARPVHVVLSTDLITFAGYYITPMVALAVMSWWAVRGGLSREMAIVCAFLVVAVLVSFWQVRGGMFSVPLAAIPLAAWIARTRKAAADTTNAVPQLVMVASWLISFNLLWPLAASSFAASPSSQTGESAAMGADCYAFSTYDALAGLPAGTVLSVSNLGSSILRQTPHRVLNGPYHRNNAGNRAALDILMGNATQSEQSIRDLGIDYVAVCPGNPETRALRGWAPEGFLADVLDGNVPEWLEPVHGVAQNDALALYFVSPR